MANQVSIVNRALTKLGAERILLLEDNTKSARVMRSIIDDVRDGELAAYRWKFAMRRQNLAALAPEVSPVTGVAQDVVPFGYAFAYPLPMDFLALVQLNELDVYAVGRAGASAGAGAGKPKWSIEGNRVLTDFGAPLRMRYIARVDDFSLFSALFVEVLACRLALEACESLTQSNTKKQMLWQEYERAVSRAMGQDAVEKAPDVLPLGAWLRAREG